MKIYERIYDNPVDKNLKQKPNVLIGEFEILDGDMDGYSYEVIVKRDDGKIFVLNGYEVSYENGGTKHVIFPLEDNYFVRMAKKFWV